ncbi:hypothetical protein C6A85_11500, partial [Mycobacterium sp. ITM-2017-0098]
DRHGLEKVKSSGDSYMVVSGVPIPRPDHLEALAHLALEIAAAFHLLQPVPVDECVQVGVQPVQKPDQLRGRGVAGAFGVAG